MKVLFVSSGNSEKGISAIVQAQGESLQKAGIDVTYFPILGKGLKGYLKNVRPLKRHMRENAYDIVHAHYSLSALAATLAGCRPLVVSLMGSDIRLSFVFRYAVKIAALWIWEALIVKSREMQQHIGIQKSGIIPNGVDMESFKPLDKKTVQTALAWGETKTHILFGSSPARTVKNFPLFEKAVELLVDSGEKIETHVLENIPHSDIPKYISASDVMVLTSRWEGSPNVIKEAMACNCPVVATDVGDVAWLFGDEPGHFLTGFDPADVADKIRDALDFAGRHGRTRGRERIRGLRLDSKSVAEKIIRVYEEVKSRKH